MLWKGLCGRSKYSLPTTFNWIDYVNGVRGKPDWICALLKSTLVIFETSALCADAFYKSKCPHVCLCVRLCVLVSVCFLFRYHLNVFLPPFSSIWYPKILKIRNPLGKVVERNGLRFEHFTQKWSQIAAVKKIFYKLKKKNSSLFSYRLKVFLPPLP